MDKKTLIFILVISLLIGLIGGTSRVLLILLEKNGFWPPSAIILWMLLTVFIGIIILSIFWVLRYTKITVMTTKDYVSLCAITSVAYLSVHWAIDCIRTLF